jgi:hypothetical protein
VKSRQDNAYGCDKNTTNIFTRCVTEFMKWRKALFEARILHLDNWGDIASDFDARADA